MAPDRFLNDFTALKNSGHHQFYVTPGVHGEVRTVRFQRWKKKPELLKALDGLLTTVAVDDAQIRGLANLIGERASPQDVDLSLMVLASQMAR